ncbi:MAG: GlxA family transcriptional regulator [Alphaproteobacteria bacterium]|nr:GlxA family transcriptional regulator [Alphaproteobacteria bacterium]
MTRDVALLVFPEVQTLDFAGPLEVFSVSRRLLEAQGRGPAYRTRVLSLDGGPLRTSSGLQVTPDAAVCAVETPPDTLLVAGGAGVYAALQQVALVDWLRAVAPKVRRVGSVCTGAFLLAEAGLLDGRAATTHWSRCATLAERYPAVQVREDPIFIADGPVRTSAGVTAGIDLALSLVEEDHGPALALEVARWLVMFVRRPGGQSQFSVQLAAQSAERAPLRELQAWIQEHPGADLTVARLAARVGMSPRNFARCFREQLGVSPGRYVRRIRLEAARQRLERSDASQAEIASTCGFGTVESLRRSFLGALAVTPGAYRERFRRRTEEN